MFVFKKKYFLIIESIKDIDFRNIKIRGKFIVIYRNLKKQEEFAELVRFRRKCKSKKIKFIVANNLPLAVNLRADGIYLSAYNKDYKPLHLKKKNFDVMGSAHNAKELNHKIKQGCKYILLSRLFKVNYKENLNFLGICKFNNYSLISKKKLVPLGGINISNLNKLKTVNSECFAIMTEVKKKPAKIFSRLF